MEEKDFIELGWMPHEIQTVNKRIYEKDNYWLVIESGNDYPPSMVIAVIDPSLLDWYPYPEAFRVILKAPTKEQLKVITELL